MKARFTFTAVRQFTPSLPEVQAYSYDEKQNFVQLLNSTTCINSTFCSYMARPKEERERGLKPVRHTVNLFLFKCWDWDGGKATLHRANSTTNDVGITIATTEW